MSCKRQVLRLSVNRFFFRCISVAIFIMTFGASGCVHASSPEAEAEAAPYHSTASASELMAVGRHSLETGEFSEAKKVFQEALALRIDSGDSKGQSELLFLLADTSAAVRDMAAAERYYRRGVEFEATIADDATLAHRYGVLGVILERRMDPDAAKESYGKAMEIYRRQERAEALAHTYIAIARIALAQGDKAEASRLADLALETAEANDDGVNIISAISMSGMVEKARGDINKACELWDSAMTRMKKLSEEKKIKPTPGLKGLTSPTAAVFFQLVALHGQNKCKFGKRQHMKIKLPGAPSLDRLWPVN